ncbi:PTS glucose transporter subunit IIA [Clostridium sp.]|uniref:PTS sugar transporter subunit IIA n=1 Tax=Clostridium sp. TaxID=1506 RepID=UPI001DF8CEF5|nr:PTS glucose transporter subunit IIA [Clostridium sp.]MBS5987096.1 PTS glucose transporter subunit IIA [Clostridium sp.]
MFKFVKKNKDIHAIKDNQIMSVSDGLAMDLKQVPDEVFSQKMMGDGFAVKLSSHIICAPVNGTITMIFPTKHAFGIRTKQGVEILVHIGLDTVTLNGKGFRALVKEQSIVKAGTPIIEIDKQQIEEAGFNTITMVIITNSEEHPIRILKNGKVTIGKDIIATLES